MHFFLNCIYVHSYIYTCRYVYVLLKFIFVQFLPESPRYLILKGEEQKAKKVLALIAQINCKQPLLVKLVTHEKKEQMLEEKIYQRSDKLITDNEISMTEMENITSGKAQTELKDYGSVSNKQDNEKAADNGLVMIPSDKELLTDSDEHAHKQMLSLDKIKKIVKEKSTEYYHWFLLLFKNGWWRTTLILWYLW